jgi:hypothetical protein
MIITSTSRNVEFRDMFLGELPLPTYGHGATRDVPATRFALFDAIRP